MTPTRLHVAACAALLLAAGCGGPRYYPVEGTVVYDDGTPAAELAGGEVSLESVADKKNAAGEIRKDGSFRIRAPLGRDGVPAGAYRALVRPPEGRRDSPIDAKYTRYTTSGIEVTVNEAPTTITVTVQRKKR
jgi:hypothetical protein